MDTGEQVRPGLPVAPEPRWQRVAVDGAELEVDVRGSGDPVVLVQTALTADELLPLARQPELGEHHTVVLYHRRGYGGSSPAGGAGSIPRDAEDCWALIAALDLDRSHVVGTSYSGAVALQLAADHPEAVATLTLVEPPPTHVPSAATFLAALREMDEDYRQHGTAAALDRFLTMLVGPGWRDALERDLPGSLARLDHDAVTFFEADLPALARWRFGRERARRITCPVLHVGGSDSGPLFAEVRALVLDWLPQAEDVVLPGADHNLAITHPAALAGAVSDFLRRHPREPRRAPQRPQQAGVRQQGVPPQAVPRTGGQR